MGYKIHELHCGSYCPHYADKIFPTKEFCCRCLLIEAGNQLVLCDTGLPQMNWLQTNKAANNFVMQPSVGPATSAIHQIRDLGFDPKDVRHILITHLDADHCGGLMDFPWATVHIHDRELTTARNLVDKKQSRYFESLWQQTQSFATYKSFKNRWQGFECVQQLEGLPPEILMVPLIGHSEGHSGFAIQSENGWVLHAGDAFFFSEDLSDNVRDRNAASELLQVHLASQKLVRFYNLNRLMNLKKKAPEIQITNSHDPRRVL